MLHIGINKLPFQVPENSKDTGKKKSDLFLK